MQIKEEENTQSNRKQLFKDFMNDYANQTKDIQQKFKCTTLGQQQCQYLIENNEIPNLKLHGQGWNAVHMDKFLKDEHWAKTPQTNNRSQISQNNQQSRNSNKSKKNFQTINSQITSQKPQSIQYNDNQSNLKTVTKRTITPVRQTVSQQSNNRLLSDQAQSINQASKPRQSKNSYFFTSVGRFQEIDEPQYKMIDFANNYCQRNFLVADNLNTSNASIHEKAQQYFDYNFGVKQKNFEKSNLDMGQQPNKLSLPSEKLKELQIVKQSQQNYQQWKNQEIYKSKKYRVLQGEYKSGIMNIDNPYNEQSVIYQDDAKRLKLIKQSQERNMKQKQELIKRHSQTNPKIEFFNKNRQIQNQINIKYEKLNPLWNNKKRIEEQFMNEYSNSQQRLFGEVQQKQVNPKRSEFLRQQDIRGRDYNFLGYNKIQNPLIITDFNNN